MFITVYTYRSKAGSRKETVSLHDELGRHPAWRGPGFLSSELLQSLEDPQEFVEITRYEDERAARETTRRPEFTAWHSRLLDTLEMGPSFSHFHRIVHSQPAPGRVSPAAGLPENPA